MCDNRMHETARICPDNTWLVKASFSNKQFLLFVL